MSETGLVYTFTTPKLQPLVTKAEGKNLIQVSRLALIVHLSSVAPADVYTFSQACLNAPEPAAGNENGVDDSNAVDSPEEQPNTHLPPQPSRPGMPGGHMPQYMPNPGMDPQSAMAYNYMQQQPQQQRGVQYMPQPGLQQHAGHQS